MATGFNYDGQLLAMIARILIETEADLEGNPRNFTQTIRNACSLAKLPEGKRPTNAQINLAMSRPAKTPSAPVRDALNVTIELLLPKMRKKNIQIRTIEAEASRRVSDQDFKGEGNKRKFHKSPYAPDQDNLDLQPKQHIKRISYNIARQLGIRENADTQRDLKSIAGDYLIVRYLFSRDKFVTSHMKIYPPFKSEHNGKPQFDLPSWFRTVGGEEYGRHDFSLVRGIVFSPDRNPDSFMSIGQVDNQINVRSAIFSRVKKCAPLFTEAKSELRDLIGIRLSFGSAFVEQVGHRIWCSSLPKNAKGQFLRRSSGTYSEDEFDILYKERVDGFDTIKTWVTAVPTMTISE